MLDMITDLQSSRIDSQRAELRPAKKLSKEGKGASLPGLRQPATAAKPEDDFLDMIARIQTKIERHCTIYWHGREKHFVLCRLLM